MELFSRLLSFASTIFKGLSQVYFGISLIKNFPFDPIFLFLSIAEPLIKYNDEIRLFNLGMFSISPFPIPSTKISNI